MTSQENYDQMSDDEIVLAANNNDHDAMDYLLEKYRYIVRIKANALFLVGGDSDDLNQEGMIGLYQAVRDYKPGQGSTFVSFASLCIARQMYKAIEADSRRKHAPLNSAISFETISETTEYLIMSDPEMHYIENENARSLIQRFDRLLSPYEKKVLVRYLRGRKDQQIADELGKTTKSVYNALQRIRSKIAAEQQ